MAAGREGRELWGTGSGCGCEEGDPSPQYVGFQGEMVTATPPEVLNWGRRGVSVRWGSDVVGMMAPRGEPLPPWLCS